VSHPPGIFFDQRTGRRYAHDEATGRTWWVEPLPEHSVPPPPPSESTRRWSAQLVVIAGLGALVACGVIAYVIGRGAPSQSVAATKEGSSSLSGTSSSASVSGHGMSAGAGTATSTPRTAATAGPTQGPRVVVSTQLIRPSNGKGTIITRVTTKTLPASITMPARTSTPATAGGPAMVTSTTEPAPPPVTTSSTSSTTQETIPPTSIPGDGTYRVGIEMQPGTWTMTNTVPPGGLCSWEIDTKGIPTAHQTVSSGRGSVILGHTQTFIPSGCGPWTKIA
jgi:hypothetical protein